MEVGRRAEADGQVDLAEGWTRFPGATPWNGDLLGRSLSKLIPMSFKVWPYMMLRVLPSSMSTLEKRVLPMMGSTTSRYYPGFGM